MKYRTFRKTCAIIWWIIVVISFRAADSPVADSINMLLLLVPLIWFRWWNDPLPKLPKKGVDWFKYAIWRK